MRALCRNCHQIERLQRSHAIPNSFFKPLARGASGQFIVLTDGAAKAGVSQDSGRDFLLCSICENLFSETFDRPIAEEIRRIRAAFLKNENIVVSDSEAVKSSIASIVWRASLSNASIYRPFNVPKSLRSALQAELWCDDARNRSFSYALQPIHDPTPTEKGGFDQKIVENLILTPKPWKVMHGFSGRVQNGWGTVFIMGGIVATMLQPRLSSCKERQKSFLLPNDRVTRIRPMDMWSVPYVREFFTYAVHKEKAHRMQNVQSYSPSSS